MRILGIDPGTGICGFGVIEGRKAIDYGVVTTPAHTPLPDRLEDIYTSLGEIITMNHPDVMAIEKLFFKQNITTGISVAEARGVCLLVAKQHHLPIFEYSPNQIKKAICGYGQAHKPQIQEMVRLHLGLKSAPQTRRRRRCFSCRHRPFLCCQKRYRIPPNLANKHCQQILSMIIY